MATDLSQGKTTPASKYETFVMTQLGRAAKRIRTLDLAAALLAFAAGTLACAVAAVLLDHVLALPPLARQVVCVVYLLAAAVYLTYFVFLPLSRRINPYFAARQLERTLPGAKNSVVNWLDLHNEDLPSAIRGAVGQRAAKDLARADVEKAVSGRRAYGAGGVAALCALAFLAALFTLGPGLFAGLLGRIFVPFGATGAAAIPAATRLTLVKPADGDAVVADDRPVEFLVRVDGRAPDPRAADALKLLLRYEPSAPYQQRPLEPDDGGRWGVTLPANAVQDGFWYKIAGGDAETPEYRVRKTPRVTDFKAVYTFRPYLARAKETRVARNIEAVRGTAVDVTVHTNRDVKAGRLQAEGANVQGVLPPGERLPDDSQGFVVHLTLDESCQYRICFTSTEGENYVEPQTSTLIAVPDQAPTATLTKPVESKEKPGWTPALHADDLLELEGVVTDDVGVAEVWLNLKVENGPTLPVQEYRSRQELQLPHGGNPTRVDYKDFVDLAKVRNPADVTFVVRPGMVLEYWLSAKDACDYPRADEPNVGESKHYRVQIVDPKNDDKAQQQKKRDDAAKEKKQHDQDQDQNNKKEDGEREQKNQETEKNQGGDSGKGGDKDKAQDGGEKSKEGTNPDKSNNPEPKSGTGDAKPGDNPQGGNQPNQGGAGDKGNPPNTDPKNADEKNQETKSDLQQGLNDLKKKEQGAGKSDPRQDQAGDGKDGGQKADQPQPAEGKDGGGQEAKKDAAEPKAGAQNQPDGKKDEGSAKDEGRPDPNHPQEGTGKAGADPKAQPDAQPGQGKDGKTEAPPQPGETKDGGKPESQKEAGGDKPQGAAAGDKTDKAEGKQGNSPGAAADAAPPGAAKDKAAPEGKSEAKGGGPDNPDKDAAKSEAKADGSQSPTGDQKPAGSAKPGAGKSDKQDVGEHKSDGGASGEKSPEDAKPQDAAEATKDLKSDDPKKRDEAAKELRQIAQQADDPQAREDAEKALKDAGLKSEDTQVAESKPKEPPGANGQPMGDAEKPAESKPGMGGDPSGAGKENPPENPKNDVTKGDSKGDGQPQDKTNPMPGQPGGTTAATAKGGPGDGAQNRHDGAQTGDHPAPPATPEKPVAQKASVLQVRKFMDAVDPKILDDAQHDPAAFQRLQEMYARWLAEHHADDGKESVADPQTGGPLASTSGHTSNPNGKGPTDDPNNGGRALPPPGYRDPYKEFTKLLSPDGDK